MAQPKIIRGTLGTTRPRLYIVIPLVTSSQNPLGHPDIQTINAPPLSSLHTLKLWSPIRRLHPSTITLWPIPKPANVVHLFPTPSSYRTCPLTDRAGPVDSRVRRVLHLGPLIPSIGCEVDSQGWNEWSRVPRALRPLFRSIAEAVRMLLPETARNGTGGRFGYWSIGLP